MKPPRILIADDDRGLCSLLQEYLQREGIEVLAVHDGDAALKLLADDNHRIDLLILDVMMPGRDGLDTLARLRKQRSLPVLMLSARGEPLDRVIGLELGADDYLAKPAMPRELLARVKALLRRGSSAGTAANSKQLALGTLKLSGSERRAWLGEAELELTGAEFALLWSLASRAGSVVDKPTLTREALGREFERYDRSIDVHVSRLRKKLSDASADAPEIEGVRGAGYQLLAP